MITLSDQLKAQIEETHQFLVERYLEDCPPHYDREPFGEIPKADWQNAKQHAYEEIRDNFEVHNSWIADDEINYEQTKNSIIQHLGDL